MSVLDHPPLRLVVCGSVDDGKSTLLGRLLFELGQLPDDRLREVESASRRFGTCGDDIDYALALDGLEDERAQGITIDVAYRSVELGGRRIILADSPGHPQYTRNMAVAASKADSALVIVDARRGIVEQTQRHTRILSLFGVPRVIFVINKMDLVAGAEARFGELAAGLSNLAAETHFADIAIVPCSARLGWNLTTAASQFGWYDGPTVLAAVATAPTTAATVGDGARLPVQLVLRPDQDFRGFAGTLHGGGLAVGDALLASPSGVVANVAALLVAGEPAEHATAGSAVVVQLDREIDVARGDVLAARAAPVPAAGQFAVHLLALADTPLLPGRPYDLQLGTRRVRGQITELKHRLDVETGQHIAATKLEANEIGYGNLHTLEPIPYGPYDQDRALSGFLLVDRVSNATVACGTIAFALRRADNIHWQALEVSAATRAGSLGQTPRCLWLTGLSGSGKSTIAARAERLLQAAGHHGYVLDGDNLRHGLNKDLGFTAADRVENIRRVAQVARLMVDAGLIVLVSFISPYRSERRMARELFADGEFVEVFVDTPLAVCEARDVKGLYAKARRGDLPNFTGIDAPYEAPESAELTVDTSHEDADQAARRILAAVGIALD